jgi:hypothetical protein
MEELLSSKRLLLAVKMIVVVMNVTFTSKKLRAYASFVSYVSCASYVE